MLTHMAFNFLKIEIQVNVWSEQDVYASSSWFSLVHESISVNEVLYSIIGRLKQAQVSNNFKILL